VAAGRTLEDLLTAANKKGFRAFPLGIRIHGSAVSILYGRRSGPPRRHLLCAAPAGAGGQDRVRNQH
jgi:hypothetical protein